MPRITVAVITSRIFDDVVTITASSHALGVTVSVNQNELDDLIEQLEAACLELRETSAPADDVPF